MGYHIITTGITGNYILDCKQYQILYSSLIFLSMYKRPARYRAQEMLKGGNFDSDEGNGEEYFDKSDN